MSLGATSAPKNSQLRKVEVALMMIPRLGPSPALSNSIHEAT